MVASKRSPGVRLHVVLAVYALTQDGWPASVREIQGAIGASSTSVVYGYLVELEKLGMLETNPRGRGRGWRLAPAGLAAATIATQTPAEAE